jgi:hypothetical protein
MTMLKKAEYHEFGSADAPYLYLVPSAAVIRLDETASAVLGAVGNGEVEFSDVATKLGDRWDREQVKSAVEELVTVRALNMVTKPVAAASDNGSLAASRLVTNWQQAPIKPVEQQRISDPHDARDHVDPSRDEIDQLDRSRSHFRPCMIFTNDRPRNSSAVSPVIVSASASVMAPELMPRRKKFSSP